jgi:hypothetical protein
MTSGRVCVAFVCLLSATMAQAVPPQETSPKTSRVRLALSVGSLGIGPEVTYRPSRWFSLRAGAGFGRIKPHAQIDGIDYRGRLKLENYGLAADLYPFGNGWRISAGIRSTDHRLGLHATPMEPIRIGSMTYAPWMIGTLSGDITTRQYAPLATIGYAGTVARGFSLGADVGVMVQGKPRIGVLTSTSMWVTAADLAAEQAQMQHDIDRFRYYPVVQMSAGYRF